MSKRVLITGAQGQLGRALLRQATTHKLQGVTRGQLDFSHTDNIRRFFVHHHYDVVVNCAAYTDVDTAEEEAELAQQVNATAVGEMARLCLEQNILLVHISTNYVFDGHASQPYREDDKPNPINVYGRSKYAGELAMQTVAPQGIILRTSWLYGLEGRNFLTTMQQIAKQRAHVNVVYDQVGSPTSVNDLAQAIIQIIDHPSLPEQRAEIYHYSHEGVASWYDLAVEMLTLWNLKCQVHPVLNSQYLTKAVRPSYSVLDKARLKTTFGLEIPYWRSALRSVYDAS